MLWLFILNYVIRMTLNHYPKWNIFDELHIECFTFVNLVMKCLLLLATLWSHQLMISLVVSMLLIVDEWEKVNLLMRKCIKNCVPRIGNVVLLWNKVTLFMLHGGTYAIKMHLKNIHLASQKNVLILCFSSFVSIFCIVFNNAIQLYNLWWTMRWNAM